MVDEGQDFTPLEFALLSKVVLRGRFGIFGDLNQSLEKGGISNWEELFEIIKEAKSSARYELSTNYRSTKPIVEFAKKILAPHTKKFMPESINRVGKEPEVVYYDSEIEMTNVFLKNLKDDAAKTDKSIGVICYDEALMPKISAAIKKAVKDKDRLIFLESSTRASYTPKGIYISNSINSKGLEFSKVYVLGLDLETIKSAEEARKAFVVTTRAMNELVIYGVRTNEKISGKD